MNKTMRYLFVVFLAREKYTKDGALFISVGNRLSPYSKVEKWAFNRYMA